MRGSEGGRVQGSARDEGSWGVRERGEGEEENYGDTRAPSPLGREELRNRER